MGLTLERSSLRHKKTNLINNVKEQFANINTILQFLDSSDYLNRRIGFALCIPKYDKFSEDFKLIIKRKWKNETLKSKMGESFTQLCNRIFSQ
ncbi:MAG: hypothetical protein ACTSRR_13535 [Candidatus Heimdallarchaeaceae archaeon]